MRIGSYRRDTGFAYVLLLVSVVTTALVAATSLSVGASMARRDAEQQLLAIGREYEAALRSYSGLVTVATPPAIRGPRSMAELLEDTRSGVVKRHLRQIYDDPLTGKPEWGLVVDAQGFISGIHSLADGRPIKQAGFEPPWEHFGAADSYSIWVFGYAPASAPRTGLP